MTEYRNRFIVINTENSDIWSPINFQHMFRNLLAREGDDWSVCMIAKGEPLPDDILTGYQGVVITGSHFNCRDRDSLPWFNPLCDFIRAAAEQGTPRIYGGCFGCQILSFALGGEVDYNPTNRFVLKAETISMSEVGLEIPAKLPFPKEFIQRLQQKGY